MRWGAGEAEFVRPVHWLVMLFGSDVMPATILDTDAGQADPRPSLPCAEAAAPRDARRDYEATLETRGHVIADFATRRERIRARVVAATRGARSAARR